MKELLLSKKIIRRKRDGFELSRRQIEQIVKGISDNKLSEGQVAAFAMAVFFQGLNHREQVDFTKVMQLSGETLFWDPDIFERRVVDKHSTGGVGDKVSLILAPIVAACGGYVPMIAGRGLGHTGGTIDKLESIPGYNPFIDPGQFHSIVREVGCAIIGQTDKIATADKRLYSIRDVTATVESIPLITASILSKKLAAGLNGLVMDVKFGSGAFMGSYDKARVLADNITAVATEADMPTVSLLTDMNEVLGVTAGNALEVKESLDFLMCNKADERLRQITIHLAIQMLMVVGITSSVSSTRKMVEESLSSGRAAELFFRMVAALGGPVDFQEKYQRYLPTARVVKPVYADKAGYISQVDARELGMVVVSLGGGRTKAGEKLDLSVGLSHVVSVGSHVSAGDLLCQLHAATENSAQKAAIMVSKAVAISDNAPEPQAVVRDII